MNQVVLKIRHILLPYCLAWFLAPALFFFLVRSNFTRFIWQWLSSYDLSWLVLVIWCMLVESCIMMPRFRHLSIPSHSRVGWLSPAAFMRGDRSFFNTVGVLGLWGGHYWFCIAYLQYGEGIVGQSSLVGLGLSLFIPLLLISWILFSPLRRWQEEASGEWL